MSITDCNMIRCSTFVFPPWLLSGLLLVGPEGLYGFERVCEFWCGPSGLGGSIYALGCFCFDES